MRRPNARPEWADDMQERIGEDPTRFLMMTQFGPYDVPEFVDARIRGIDSIAVANTWLIAEQRLFDRPGVKKRLRTRIEELLEIGERPERLNYLGTLPPEPEPMEVEPTWEHTGCAGTNVKRESKRTWFCDDCQQRTNRVQEVAVT